MDVREFSDWLLGIKRLSTGQRREALAVLAKVGMGAWRLWERDEVPLSAPQLLGRAREGGL